MSIYTMALMCSAQLFLPSLAFAHFVEPADDISRASHAVDAQYDMNDTTLVSDGIDMLDDPGDTSLSSDSTDLAPDAPDGMAGLQLPDAVDAGEAKGQYRDHVREPVDINTASAISLAGLPRLGPREAQAIIAGRPYAGLHELITRNIIDAECVDAIAPMLYAGTLPTHWMSQAQSRAWWHDGESPATALGVSTSASGWRVGMAVTTQANTQQPVGGLEAKGVGVRDGFVQQMRGPHAWVLGYYDIGFADRLTFDSTLWVTPDGIQRGAPILAARRPPKLLGGAYAWQQRPTAASGLATTVFVATHPMFKQVAGVHVAYAWNARSRLSATSYAARGEVASPDGTGLRAVGAPMRLADVAVTHQALGVAASAGWGPCDGGSEGAMTSAHALAYSVHGMCEPLVGWRMGAVWRDLDADFDNPFSRVDRGRPTHNRRMVGVWSRLRAPLWEASGHLDVSWPRACRADLLSSVAALCPAPALSVRQEARVSWHPRHVLRSRARSWRGKPQNARWNHTLMLAWNYGGHRGWAGTVSTTWQASTSSTSPAHLRANTRLVWRHPKLLVGAYVTTGIEATHWQGGLSVAHRVSPSATLNARFQMGQASAMQPMRHAALLVAKVIF